MLPKSRNVKGRSLVIAPRITKRHAAKPNLLCSYDDASVPAAPECVLSVGCPSSPAVTSNSVSLLAGLARALVLRAVLWRCHTEESPSRRFRFNDDLSGDDPLRPRAACRPAILQSCAAHLERKQFIFQ